MVVKNVENATSVELQEPKHVKPHSVTDVEIKSGEILKLFHRHVWEEHLRMVVPPKDINMMGEAKMPLYLFERIVGGITTIIFRCSKCKKTRSQEFLGVPEQSPSNP